MQDFTNKNKGTSLPGDFTMAEGTTHRRYACTTDGICEIRVVPSFNGNDPEPLILREEISLSSLSDAFIKVGMVQFFGKMKFSLIEVPPPEGVRQGPLQFFYNYVVDEVKTKPRTCSPDWRRWQGLRDEGDIQAPKRILTPPSATLMCQGLLVQHKGQLCLDKNGEPTLRYPVVLAIKPSGGKSLLDSLLEPKDKNAPWSDDNNMLGNLVNPDRGCTLKVIPYETEHNGMRQTWYRCEAGQNIPITVEQAKSIWKPWDQVLNLHMSVSEVIAKIAETFDARSVVQVFESNPVYAKLIPQEVYDAKAREERITVSPGMVTAGPTVKAYVPEERPYIPAPGVGRAEPETHRATEDGLKIPAFMPDAEEDPIEEEGLFPKEETQTTEQRLAALKKRISG